MILVVGATGQLGGAVAGHLLRAGHAVRILVRPNSPSERLAQQGLATSVQALVQQGAETVSGDLTEPTSLARACRGVHTVITTANSAARPEATVEQVDLWGNRHLIDAAVAAGVRRFFFVSAQFADPQSPVDLLRAKAETEAYLRASGLDYTIIAPNAFMDTWITLLVLMPIRQGRPVTLVGNGTRRHSFIALQDVAAFIQAALEHPAARCQRLVLGGPAALSLREVVAICEQVLGRPIPVEQVAPGEPIPGLPQEVWPIAASFDAFDAPVEMDETARTFGIALTPLEAFVRQQLANITTGL